MSEMPEKFVVTEGRAYHVGDIIILRSRSPLSKADADRLNEQLRRLGEELHVRFVLLGEDMEVVEPREVVEPN